MLVIVLIQSLLQLIGFGVVLGSFIMLVVIVIAINYQNTNKLFDNIGIRFAKKSLEAFKKGFQNYLSFK